jgi:hypothetical protein
MLDVPDAPRSLTATAGSGEIRLDWVAPSSNGGTEVRYYEIERTVDGADWSDHWYVSSTGVTRTVTDLTNGIPYFYRVSAVSSVGTSAASNVVTATPRTVPSAVRSLREAAAADDLTGLAVVGHLLVHAVEPPRLGDPPGVVAGLVTGRPPAVVPRDHGVVVVHEPQVGGVARPDRDETEPRGQQRSLGPGHPAQPCHRSAFEHTAFATISV